MSILELIYRVVLTLVIGFTVMIVFSGIIGKIGEESRKNSDHAEKMIDRMFEKMPKMITGCFKEVMKIGETQNQDTTDTGKKEKFTIL